MCLAIGILNIKYMINFSKDMIYTIYNISNTKSSTVVHLY